MNIKKKFSLYSYIFLSLLIVTFFQITFDFLDFVKEKEYNDHIKRKGYLKTNYILTIMDKLNEFNLPETYRINKFNTNPPKHLENLLVKFLPLSLITESPEIRFFLMSDDGTVQSFFVYNKFTRRLDISYYYEKHKSEEAIKFNWYPLIKEKEFDKCLYISYNVHSYFLNYVFFADTEKEKNEIDNLFPKMKRFGRYALLADSNAFFGKERMLNSFNVVRHFKTGFQDILIEININSYSYSKYFYAYSYSNEFDPYFMFKNVESGFVVPVTPLPLKHLLLNKLFFSSVIIIMLAIFFIIVAKKIVFRKMDESLELLLTESGEYLEKQYLSPSPQILIGYFNNLNSYYLKILKEISQKWQVDNLKEVNEGSERMFRDIFDKYQKAQREKAQKEAELSYKMEELNFARRIQLSMLPESDLDLPGMEVTGYMRTATEVGGDYFDYICLDDENYAIVLGDATGHGVGAGIVVGMLKSSLTLALRNFSPDKDSLEKLMDALNETLKNSVKKRGLGICLQIALVNQKKGTARIISGGLPYPYLYRFAKRELNTIKISGPPLGLMSGLNLKTVSVDLDDRDVLILTSDGFTERMNKENEEWGDERLKKSLLTILNESEKNKEIILRFVEENDKFARGRENNDDMTIIIIRKKNQSLQKENKPRSP